MDARLLGALPSIPWRRIAGACRPLAAAALAVQAATGLLLLVPDATALVANPAFRLKLATIALALANVVVLEWLVRRRLTAYDDAAPLPPGAGVCAAISLALWLATATLGRLIAYV